ncbi:lysine--tRNA ligase [Pyrodictium abyssi]|uniref:Lysine--tRNA ligase n=1 Tax=Pyrodictium abyssi TaxID=54256 RepID=A0ABN6ZKN5_9CREN|nr:lysine--tRNA ligase [Pyrodictium abyssi]
MAVQEVNDIRKAKFLREPVVESQGELKHWIEALADWLEERFKARGKDVYVVNGGLSVSGLQHVGRLRGEVVIPEVVRRLLESRGLRVRQYLTLYTQDAWKGKESQRSAFPDPEAAKKYTGWPLIKVPDPKGELSSWIDRFWADFGPYIGEFTDGRVEVVNTTDMYRGKLLEFVKLSIQRREEIREIVNKYRGRKPYPPGWIPFEPRCQNCGRIDTTEAIEVSLDEEKVKYRCRSCGHEGWAPLWDGKLNWRIEWVGVWWALGVDFEPYGKDHATPGGSRDSANELALKVYGITPPEGLPYEWVSLRTRSGESDMSSSDFTGFTPREWLEVAHPEVLRFLILRTPPMRKLSLGLHEIPLYYDQYYRAERVYYGVESTGRREEDILLARSYELSYTRGKPPARMPAQPPYTHMAILAQVLPEDRWGDEAIRRLQRSGHLPQEPSEFDLERVRSLLPRARRWAELYAPEYMRIRVLEELPAEIVERIHAGMREKLRGLGEKLAGLEEWSEDAIKQAMIEYTRGWGSGERKEFYRYFYLVFVGRESGPRAAPLLSLLDREFVVKRLTSL